MSDTPHETAACGSRGVHAAREANQGNAESKTGLQNSGKQTSSAVRVRPHRQLGLGLVEQGHEFVVGCALHHAAAPRGGMRQALEVPARERATARHEGLRLVQQREMFT